jgi:hypothetical protein
LIPSTTKIFDTSVEWHGTSNVPADCWTISKVQQLRAFWINSGSKINEYLPFRACLGDARTRNLGREIDSALSRGLSTSAGLFIPSRRRQEHHRITGLHKHLMSKNDILVDPEWDTTESLSTVPRIWKCTQIISPNRPQHVDLASMSSVHRFYRRESAPIRYIKAP